MKTKTILFFILMVSYSTAFCQKKQSMDTGTGNEIPYLYLEVDKLPVFKHEDMTVMEFIYKKLKWPKSFDGQGTVIASFVVKNNGTVCDVKIIKRLTSECDNEVKRVLLSMPKWMPGEINNRTVNVTLYLPIRFVVNVD